MRKEMTTRSGQLGSGYNNSFSWNKSNSNHYKLSNLSRHDTTDRGLGPHVSSTGAHRHQASSSEENILNIGDCESGQIQFPEHSIIKSITYSVQVDEQWWSHEDGETRRSNN